MHVNIKYQSINWRLNLSFIMSQRTNWSNRKMAAILKWIKLNLNLISFGRFLILFAELPGSFHWRCSMGQWHNESGRVARQNPIRLTADNSGQAWRAKQVQTKRNLHMSRLQDEWASRRALHHRPLDKLYFLIEVPSEKSQWINRGVAVLCQLDD